MKKMLSMLLVMILLAGCASSKGNESDNSPDGNAKGDAKKITIRTASMYGGTDPGSQNYRNIMNKFMEDYPNVTIEDESAPIDEQWRASVINDFNSGNEPDVIYFVHHADGQALVDTGQVVSVETIREVYPDYATNIYGSALNVLRKNDGQVYCVPMTGYWMGTFVNTELFEEYGLELPTDWEKLVTAIKTFKENGITPFALALGHIPHFFIEHMFLSAGGVEALLERPGSEEEIPESWIKGLEILKELYDMGAFPEDTNSTTEEAVKLLFNEGKAAMLVSGTWHPGSIPVEDPTGQLVTQDQVAVMPFPMHPDGKGTPGIVGGWNGGFYISKTAWDDPDKRDYVVKLVQAHTSSEAISHYTGKDTGGVSPDSSVPLPEVSDRPLVDKGFKFWAQYSENHADPACDHMKSDPKNILYQGLTNVVKGDITPEQLLKKVVEKKPFDY